MTESISDFLARTGAIEVSVSGEIVAGAGISKQVVWKGPATTVVPIAAVGGVQMTVTSSSANDASSAGTGVRKINIVYIDSTGAQQSEEVALNGITGVPTVATDIRFIQEVHMSAVGSGGAAAGNISVTNGGTTYGYLAAGDKRSTNAFRMVPTGYRMVVHRVFPGAISGTAAAQVQINLGSSKINGYDFTASGILVKDIGWGLQDGSETMSGVDYVVEAGEIVGCIATSDKAATIFASFSGWLEPVVY